MARVAAAANVAVNTKWQARDTEEGEPVFKPQGALSPALGASGLLIPITLTL